MADYTPAGVVSRCQTCGGNGVTTAYCGYCQGEGCESCRCPDCYRIADAGEDTDE